jgi:hypothetical protein
MQLKLDLAPLEGLAMSKKHSVAPLNLYCGLMEEIKIRIRSIETILRGQMAPPFPGAIAREHCFLQLRMVCEIVAIGCLVIHNQTSAVNALEKLWNAKDIMDRLEQLNPYCFPRAVRIFKYPAGSPIGFDIHPLVSPGLTKQDFLKLYGHCGDALHRGHLRKIATNVPTGPVNLEKIGAAINDLKTLLGAHQISSADYKHHYTCVMENTPGGPCAIVTSLSDPNLPPSPPAQ